MRSLWKHYYENTRVVVWVVDASDEKRMEESKSCLASVMSEIQLKDALLLVIANKQDVAGALTPEQISTKLEIEKVAKGRPYHVQGTSAKPSIVGIEEGLEWVAKELIEIAKKSKKEKK